MSDEDKDFYPHKPLAVCVYQSRRVVEEENTMIFGAYAARVPSMASPGVMVIYCEQTEVISVTFPSSTDYKRIRSKVVSVVTNASSLTSEIVDELRALAREWGVEK